MGLKDLVSDAGVPKTNKGLEDIQLDSQGWEFLASHLVHSQPEEFDYIFTHAQSEEDVYAMIELLEKELDTESPFGHVKKDPFLSDLKESVEVLERVAKDEF